MSQAYPRDTAFWRTQHRLFVEALDVARANPAVQALRIQLRRLLAEADGPGMPEVVTIMGPYADDPVMVLFFLVQVTRQVSPGLDHALGPLLPRFMLAWVDYELTGIGPLDEVLFERWRWLPGIPLVMDVNGGILGWELVKPKEYPRVARLVRDYFQSFKPAGRKGRRPKPPPPATKRTRPLTPKSPSVPTPSSVRATIGGTLPWRSCPNGAIPQGPRCLGASEARSIASDTEAYCSASDHHSTACGFSLPDQNQPQNWSRKIGPTFRPLRAGPCTR